MTKKNLKTTCLCSSVALATALSFIAAVPQARADQVSDLQGQMNQMSIDMAKMKAEESKILAQEARQHQELIAQEAHDKQVQEATANRQVSFEQEIVQQNAAANKALQKMTPTTADRIGIPNNQYVTKGALPGSFIVPGTNTSMRIGGFIPVDTIYNPGQSLGPRFQIGNLLPSNAQTRATEGQYFMHTKLARLIVQTSTPSSYGAVTTNFALDLDGFANGGDNTVALQNNSDSARVVFAYGTIGPLAMGMMWSDFIDQQDQGETIDHTGPAGIPAERTEQIAYTIPVNQASVFTLAIASPQAGYQDTQDNIEVASKTNPVPDFSAKWEYTTDVWHLQLSGILRDPGFTDINGNRHLIVTGAGIAGATYTLADSKFGFGQDNFGGQVWFGGIGRYIPDDFGANVASVLAVNDGTASNPTGATQVKIQPDQGLTAFYQHYWTPKLRSSISIGYNHQNLASFLPPDANNAPQTKTLHVNLIFRPVHSVDIGVEYMVGQKTFQRSTGITPRNAQQFQFSGIWHF